jgi:type I restriction enzyme M protein
MDSPSIAYGNSLAQPLTGIGDSQRVDVILTNPPFGGEEERGILGNFPEDKQTAETALLFLQLIMRKLRRAGAQAAQGGRAAVVVPNGTLFGDGVSARIKEELLREFDLHTVVRLPNGVFAPYTAIPTNLLFFQRGGPTEAIWYYEQPLPEGRKSYSKTKPLRYEEFAPLLAWWNAREENEHAWRVPVADVLKYDASGALLSANLDLKNPHSGDALEHLAPEELVDEVLRKEAQIQELLLEIRAVLGGQP